MSETHIVPKLGLVTPTKELSSIPTTTNEDSDLLKLIARWPDAPNFFLAVYHHTMLNQEMKVYQPPLQGETRYDLTKAFPDPIALLSVLARIKTHNELFTAVMVAPQLQTPALAQQVTAIANASRGRFSLGVGVGWNPAEYEAVGMGRRFKQRGTILNQQIPALEMMLTGMPVNLTIGQDDEIIRNMAINPPAHYEVPIWVGGLTQKALERAARFGNGWMPLGDVEPFKQGKPYLMEQLAQNDRDPKEFGLMGRITLGTKTTMEAVDDLIAWMEAGVTHVVLTTTGAGESDWQKHSTRIADFLRATEWLRYPEKASFGSLFGSGTLRAPVGIFNSTDTERLCCKTKVDPKYVWHYLNSQGFRTVSNQIEGIVHIPHLTPHPLKVIDAKQDQSGRVVWTLESTSESKQTYLIYDSSIEIHHHQSHR